MSVAIKTSICTDGLRGKDDRDAAWYYKKVPELDDKTRELLEQYAKIPPERVEQRLMEFVSPVRSSLRPGEPPPLCSQTWQRDRIWAVFPYPIVGQFRFVELNAYRHGSYAGVIQRLRDGHRLLDVGCCFAQEMRRMVLDGAPSDNMVGADLMGSFIDLAYDFFGDRETFRGRFIVGDVAAADADMNPALSALFGSVDLLHVGMVMHLWDLEGQTRFCEQLIRFLKPEPGVVMFGHSAGRVEAADWFNPVGRVMYKQNPESFAKMWAEVGRRTGTSWKVDSWLYQGQFETNHWDDPQSRKLLFEVTRL